jgi:hypothetical protein
MQGDGVSARPGNEMGLVFLDRRPWTECSRCAELGHLTVFAYFLNATQAVVVHHASSLVQPRHIPAVVLRFKARA